MKSPLQLFEVAGLTLMHGENSFKIGTDALLCTAFSRKFKAKQVADFGSGCGIIGLVYSTLFPDSFVTLIENQALSTQLLEQNISKNQLQNVQIIECDVHTFSKVSSTLFDAIISNPPFYFQNHSSPYFNKNLSKHTSVDALNQWIYSCSQNIRQDGFIILIFPFEFLKKIKLQSLFINEILYVRTLVSKPFSRVCVKLSFSMNDTVINYLTILKSQKRNDWTHDYIRFLNCIQFLPQMMASRNEEHST